MFTAATNADCVVNILQCVGDDVNFDRALSRIDELFM